MKTRILSSFFSSTPNHLILHVTNKCNLRCKTCFVDFNNNKEKELTLDEIASIARYLGKILWLDISGGEPFLRQDLPEICSKFNTKSIGIPTNGYNPELIYKTTQEIQEKTKAELSIAISIDGFEKTNDSIKNKGCFRKSIETLKLLKTLPNVRIKINTVLCEQNYEELIDFMNFIKEFNPDFHSIIFLRGKARNANFRLPSYEKLARIKEDIFKIWKSYNYNFFGLERKILQNYQRRMYETSLKILKEKKQILKCLAHKQHLVIYSNGDVAFCELLPSFGNLRNQQLKALLNSKKVQEQRKFIQNKQCYCHHNCNLLDNFFLNPLQYPKLLRGISK